MKDIFSKITFGFLMAQLAPGVIVIYSSSFLYMIFRDTPNSFSMTMSQVNQFWFDSSPTAIIFFALSVGAGMSIHGLHWSILGYLEGGKFKSENMGLIPKLRLTLEKRNFFCQILFCPGFILLEIIGFLFTVKKTEDVILEENVTSIPDSKMEAFHFLQSFYLSFAQFYIHTGYALYFSFVCLLVGSWQSCFICGDDLINYQRLIVTIFIYILAGYFFLIGRIQFGSLFAEEEKLIVGPTKIDLRLLKIDALLKLLEQGETLSMKDMQEVVRKVPGRKG